MHHQTEQLSGAAESFSRRIEPVPQRVREIAMLRGLGYSFREIARQYHVTPQAISLMLSRHRRAMGSLRGSLELSHLSARAVNALGRHGILSRQEAIRRNALDLVKSARNCGRKTLDEISEWIGQSAGSNQSC
jgi:DNA-binding NarL/FixJ family response regulator